MEGMGVVVAKTRVRGVKGKGGVRVRVRVMMRVGVRIVVGIPI